MTSSAAYSEEIHKVLYGDAQDHGDCRRVEDAFDVRNAIETGESV